MFKYFKKDFYKYFIDNKDKVIKRSIKIEKEDSEEEKSKITKVKKIKA